MRLVSALLLQCAVWPTVRHVPVDCLARRKRELPAPGPRRRLAGSFVSQDKDKGPGAKAQTSDDDSWRQEGREGVPSPASLKRQATGWNTRSASQRARWADPEFAGTALRKRAQTQQRSAGNANVTEGSAGALKRSAPSLSTSLQATPTAVAAAETPAQRSARLRSEAMRLMRSDEQTWMEARLAAGQSTRERRNDPDLLKQRREARAAAAAKRYETRRKNAEAAREQKPEDCEK